MIKKIIPIVTIILAVGLFAFVLGVQKQEKELVSQYDEWYAKRRPLTVQKEQLEQELVELDKEYEKQKLPKGTAQVLFTNLDTQVYSACYPIMKEYGYTGTLALSPEELPGAEGCITVEQFRELLDAGWGICITWQSGKSVNRWWPGLQAKLSELGIAQGQVVYFPKGTYSAGIDKSIQELGFTIAVSSKEAEETPLQLQYEEGVWHVGAVGMMTKKPRLWLREAVAQDANITFLVGFELEEELYNEKSFRTMLNCLDEYIATEELIVNNIDAAREHYYRRISGVDPAIESQYQQKKAALEEELSQVEKQLEEIDAQY